MKRVVLVALLACKRDEAEPPPAPPPALAIAAEIRGPASLVDGTHRIALRTSDDGWYDVVDGRPQENAQLGAAIAREVVAIGGIADVFLGTTPIVVGGEHHHEVHVRVRPAREPIELDGTAVEIVTTSDGREAWRYEHELSSQVAFVQGTEVVHAPAIARIGPDADGMSPVSRRRCREPRVVDVDAAGRTAYALVTECNDATPLRVLAYDRPDAPREIRMQSADALELAPAALAIGGGATPVVVAGIRAPGQLAIARVRPDGHATISTHLADVSRVLDAVVADDGAVWVLAYTGATAVIARDDIVVPLVDPAGTPVAPRRLARDAQLGAVVLGEGKNAAYLFAERPPPTSVVITPRR